MAKLEIKDHIDPNSKETYKAIFVDGKLFDWYIDKDELNKAKRFSRGNEARNRVVVGDVIQFFMECFREFLGKEISLQEVNKAIRTGELEI